MASRSETRAAAGGARDGRRVWRIALGGLLAAVAVALSGWALEGRQLGRSDTDTVARVEREVREKLAAKLAALRTIAGAVAARPDLVRLDADEIEGTSRLFALLEDAIGKHASDQFAATVYGAGGVASAWTGRPSDLPRDRVTGPDAIFVVPSPLGLRLFLMRPVFEAAGAGSGASRRVGTVAAECALSPPSGVATLSSDNFRLPTSIVPVSLRTRYEGAGGSRRPNSFLVSTPDDAPLLEVQVSPDELAAVRARWRRGVIGTAVAIVGVMLLLLVGPILDRRLHARTVAAYARLTGAALLLVLLGRALFWLATPAAWASSQLFSSASAASSTFGPMLRSPLDFLLTSLALVALIAIAAPAVARARPIVQRKARAVSALACWTAQILAGLLLAVLLLGHQWFLSDAVYNTSVDTLRFSLHPWDPTRLSLIAGLIFFQAANLWLCTLLVAGTVALAGARRRSVAGRAGLALAWLLPVAAVAGWGGLAGWPTPLLAVTLAGISVALAALLAHRALAWYRHATQATRLLALLATLVLPGLLLYPAVLHHAERAKRALIETDFAVQPAAHPQELQSKLDEALRQIDAIADLSDLVAAAPPGGAPIPTESAFRVWSHTTLAVSRLTSAVELYGADGSLVSRFALNLPEYTALAQNYSANACAWEVFGEAAPFGSEERRMLHAERGFCAGSVSGAPPRPLGTIVVHVMLDYRSLPFLTSQGPYQQMLRAAPAPPDEGTRGGDVELAIYGWSLLPIYTSGPGAWPIDEALFARIYDASRDPFWTDLPKGGTLYHVHVSNDRGGIYAIGYPAPTAVDHLERLAEIATLCAVIHVVLLAGAVAFGRLSRDRARAGVVLLREIRASFYRKLFLAFVLASAVPVVTLAVVVRAYFAVKLRTDAEAEAARTAAVAERVIEEFAALQRRGGGPLAPLTDDLMVLISQLIDQDVNIFEGPRLVATSERDLFASGLLPQRTPAEIYRAIRLQRLPSYVGEDAIGPIRYLIAAAPVRAGARDTILTVPLALRQREIEREIDDLNRGVNLAAMLFILLGAGIGLSMAERIADPVRRLTRATRRIARGDFDARILVRSSDELQRLVDAFNSMASELKAQATQLERTHRLEAWAEMARQVAHEIKNPLTPIQLSAEHLRRVHADRGAPLSPVLESCVDSILRQVGLLRQIAAEFSAFASSPVPHPAPAIVAELIDEVVDPYRAGLGDRIRIDVNLADGLPAIRVDRTLVARALVNVVENALHAMPGTGALSVVARPEGCGARIIVTDTGVGMDHEALARVFEPYFSTKTAGTGLGLTIAKRNIETSGGTIAVESARARGTTVTLWLPAQD